MYFSGLHTKSIDNLLPDKDILFKPYNNGLICRSVPNFGIKIYKGDKQYRKMQKMIDADGENEGGFVFLPVSFFYLSGKKINNQMSTTIYTAKN